MLLPFGRTAPALPASRPPLPWSGSEFAADAAFEQPEDYYEVPLTSALIDDFERDAFGAIRVAEEAQDIDALRAAYRTSDRIVDAYRLAFVEAFHAALRRAGVSGANVAFLSAQATLRSLWWSPAIPPIGRKSKEAAFAGAMRSRAKWAREARDLVRRAMMAPREAVAKLGPGAVTLRVAKPLNLSLAGHPVRFEAVGALGEGALRLAAEKLDVALRSLRATSARAWPGYMRDLPPIVVSPEGCAGFDEEGEPGGGALYDPDRPGGPVINICANELVAESPDRIAYVIAHESGHHLWITVLSEDARREWSGRVSEARAELPLGELLRHWPVGATWSDALRSLAVERPELALVVRGGMAYGDLEPLSDRARVVEALRRGERWEVPARSITRYAVSAPDEAFCEALALMLTRGPAALHDDVAQWLREAAPRLRTHGNPPKPPRDQSVPALFDPLRPLAAPVRTEVVAASPGGPAELRHTHYWVVATKSARERPWTLVAACNSRGNAERVLTPYVESGAHVALVPPDDAGVIALRDGASVHRQGRPARYVRRDPLPVEEWDDGQRVAMITEANPSQSRRSYPGVDFTPPEAVQRAMRRGLDLRALGHAGPGLRPETVAWARRMAQGEPPSVPKVRAMPGWFARHDNDRERAARERSKTSPAYTAWMLWGGARGGPWSRRINREMDAADAAAGR